MILTNFFTDINGGLNEAAIDEWRIGGKPVECLDFIKSIQETFSKLAGRRIIYAASYSVERCTLATRLYSLFPLVILLFNPDQYRFSNLN